MAHRYTAHSVPDWPHLRSRTIYALENQPTFRPPPQLDSATVSVNPTCLLPACHKLFLPWNTFLPSRNECCPLLAEASAHWDSYRGLSNIFPAGLGSIITSCPVAAMQVGFLSPFCVGLRNPMWIKFNSQVKILPNLVSVLFTTLGDMKAFVVTFLDGQQLLVWVPSPGPKHLKASQSTHCSQSRKWRNFMLNSDFSESLSIVI